MQPTYPFPSSVPVAEEPTPEPEAPAKRKPRSIALKMAAVVVAGAAIAGSLYAYSDLRSQKQAADHKLAATTKTLHSTKDQLHQTESDLNDTQSALTAEQSTASHLASETTTCVNGMIAFLSASSADLTDIANFNFATANRTAALDPSWASTCHDANADAQGISASS